MAADSDRYWHDHRTREHLEIPCRRLPAWWLGLPHPVPDLLLRHWIPDDLCRLAAFGHTLKGYLEFMIGQFSRCNPAFAYYRYAPAFRGLGLTTILITVLTK